MPRHPRTIYKPFYIEPLIRAVDSGAPGVGQFSSVRSVSADASQGLALRHLELLITMGLTRASLDNAETVLGFMGFFKWPENAAAPTDATIDLENRTKIFGRRSFALQGTVPRTYSTRLKSARLTLGEELFVFWVKTQETNTDLLLTTAGAYSHYETQA